MIRSGAVRSMWRAYSSFKMTLTDDGSTFVAFHPEPKVPYEDSRPLPVEPAKVETASPLMSTWEEARSGAGLVRGEPEELAIRKLSAATLTTKHRWYPRSRDKKAKKTPMDRPYL